MSIQSDVQALVEPLIADFGAELYDVTWGGGRLLVAVDAPGGVDTTTLAKISRTISQELDSRQELITTRYRLEVSSPGLERKLRRPEHFIRSVGQTVSLKLKDTQERLSGVITQANETEVVLQVEGQQAEGQQAAQTAEANTPRAIPYNNIARAQTVFQWPSMPTTPNTNRPPTEQAETTGG